MKTHLASAAIITLGCRLNQADTALLNGRLRSAGYDILPYGRTEKIDLILINTCTVTGTASRKSLQAVRRAKREHPEALIVMTGCCAELKAEKPGDLDLPDILVSNEDKKNIIEIIGKFRSGKKEGNTENPTPPSETLFREKTEPVYPFRSRAFLKIQEGCNNFCSYCIVPHVRGRERSRHWDEVITEFSRLLEAGYREIVLTGVNTCAYRFEKKGLPELLRALSSEKGDFRIRLSSTEPSENLYEILDVMADNPRICRFLHLSLQHGTDEILRKMNRKYTVREYAEFVRTARKKIPGLHLGTDIITGFPGETDEIFSRMCAFLKSMDFANTHIFPYSPRKGTPAVTMKGKIPRHVARERAEKLRRIAFASASEFAASQVGKILPVIPEKRKGENFRSGWSDNYLNVEFKGKPREKNSIVKLRIENVCDGVKLKGRIVL